MNINSFGIIPQKILINHLSVLLPMGEICQWVGAAFVLDIWPT